MQEGSCEWSSEGRYILYVTGTRLVGSGTDLRVLPLFGDRKPFHYLAAPGNQLYAQFSPDGGWVAYSSDESGPLRLMWRVPLDECEVAAVERWRRDGKKIFFLSWAALVCLRGSADHNRRHGPPTANCDAELDGAVERQIALLASVQTS